MDTDDQISNRSPLADAAKRIVVLGGKGAGAGLLATVPMSLAMLLLHQLLPTERWLPLPPKEITARSGRKAGADMDETELRAATVVAHLGYGSAVGALYGPLGQTLPLPPLLSGVLYGLLVWFFSYMGWLPALGLMAPATEQSRGRNIMLIVSHVVWGGFSGWLVGKQWTRGD